MTKVIRTMMHIIQTGQYDQQILQHLEGVWEDLQPPSPSVFKRIMAFITGPLAAQYKVTALNKFAEYMVSSMNLHLLNMLAVFQENAELEGISVKHRDETLNKVLPQIKHIMEEISDRLSIQSLDDLATLVNITTGLKLLSETDSADRAQNWLYELPALYRGHLQKEGLLRDTPMPVGHDFIIAHVQRGVDWLSSLTHKDHKLFATDESHTST